MSNYPLDTIRHSAAHVMAAAVQKLYPDAKFDIGPATENGFYYDFDMEHRLVNEDLKEIEKQMKKLIGRKLPFEHFELPRAEAEKMLKEAGQPIFRKARRSVFTRPATLSTSAAARTSRTAATSAP